jgi:hypothetical protein
MTGFQSRVNTELAPAVEGDFASSNPYSTYYPGPGAFLTGVGGAVVGAFAWATLASGTVINSGTGVPTGFVHREVNALVGTIGYLQGEASMVIPQGREITLHTSGDYWVRANGGTAVTAGQKVFAKLADGSVTTGAAGATIAGYIETKWTALRSVAAGELFPMSTWV